jgi:hypothetical protein
MTRVYIEMHTYDINWNYKLHKLLGKDNFIRISHGNKLKINSRVIRKTKIIKVDVAHLAKVG